MDCPRPPAPRSDKNPQGLRWMRMPVPVKGRYHQKIRESEIDGAGWVMAYWKALVQNYRRAPHLDAIAEWPELL
ncbi:WbqC family protein [Cupriavidus basilensis]|uniref:WbqC family protein n=1 Tax=Cupriavidus basilensis TaxID=68895 RepID=UPI003C2EE01F